MSSFTPCEDGCSPPESPHGGEDAERNPPQELGGKERAARAVFPPPVKKPADVPDQQEGPRRSDRARPCGAGRGRTSTSGSRGSARSQRGRRARARTERPILER